MSTLETTPDTTADATWWRQAVVYQIYPRSFADSDGDGIGDLTGITARVSHLVSLGVDAVWLSPFYPSALADGGYDVDHYRDVAPEIGTLEQFDEMVAALHGAGIKVVVDIVPNHSSDRHEWFRAALAAAPGSPERERYVFRRGRGEHGELPPTDWTAMFGGSSWEHVGDGEWYLHSFAPEQPDWNWDNPEVREDFLTTLRFWSDRGVDGFRVDVAHALVKDLTEPLPSTAQLVELEARGDGSHPFWDRDEVHEVFTSWREVFDSYDPPRTAVAEAWVQPHRLARYAAPTGLGQAFNFDLLRSDFDAASFRAVVEHNLRAAAETGSSSTWVLSNHDVVRHVSRYGLPDGSDVDAQARWLTTGGTEPALDLARGARRARAATAFLLALPGSAYLYQGEELGLPEVADLDGDDLQDPTWLRTGGAEKGRDGCRVPIPWTAGGRSFGFGEGPSHLPQPSWFGDYAVDVQDEDPTSSLTFYRDALARRAQLQTEEELDFEDAPEGVVQFRRPGGWVCATNFTGTPVPLPAGRVVLSSAGPLDGELPGETTAWLVRD